MTDVTLHAPFAGWLSTIDEVADPVFATRMIGDGFAIDPTEGVLRAPADGDVISVAASAHAVTLRLRNGAELLLHIGLDTVALGGAGFRAQVGAGTRVQQGQPLIAFDLDAVARAAKDMVTPIVLASEGGTLAVERPGRLVAAGEPIARVTAAGAAPSVAGDGEQRRTITVAAPHGLHARPAARVAALLRPYAAEVTLALGDKRASGRSMVAMLALGAAHGAALEASATGPDAAAALDALTAFAAERFGDADVAASVAPVSTGPGGVCASPGLAIGRIHQLRLPDIAVPEQGEGVAAETAALDAALARVDAGLGRGELADAHRAILHDPMLRAGALDGIAAGQSAGHAWRRATDDAAAALTATGDARLAERVADLRDIERQLLLALTGAAPAAPAIAPASILVADDLLPSQFLALDTTRLAGIVTAAGGPTAHVAILAAAAGVPMVVAAGRGVLDLAEDTPAVLDADAARLTPDPDTATLAAASERIAAMRASRTTAQAQAHAPCVTADGTRIEVFANLGSAADAAAAVAAGAEGCGLLRTEFLFLDRDAAPDEAEQRQLYTRIATALGERPLIVRTLDVGGDKPVPYWPRVAEENPALGQRGIRLSLARPDLLATQLRAILAGVPGAQCRIMLPMVVEVAEVVAVRALLAEAAATVGRVEPVQLGVMIETPAAAMLADQLAVHADFLSVGTNDLTQYALAADRGNAAVSAMVDALHPAVLRLIRHAADGARRHGRWLGVCGGLASEPRAAALLVGLGVTELSAVPAVVPAVKAAVRRVAMPDALALAERALAAESATAVRALLEDKG